MQGFCLLKIKITQFPDGFCLRDISDIEKLRCKFSYASESQPIWGANDVSYTQDKWYLHSESPNDVFFHIVISSCHFSIFKRFEIKNYKADRRRNVYIDTKHMESTLYGTVLMHSLLLYRESHLFAGLTCFISHITSTHCAYHMQKLPISIHYLL